MKNQPAFPRSGYLDTSSGTLPDGDEVIRHQDGMTLRDYFAAAYITGALGSRSLSDSELCDNDAAIAYKMADAMLEARK